MQHTTQKNIIKVNISIPPETKFRGYRGITLSIYLCNRVRSISFWRWKIGSSDFTQRLLTTRRYAIILKQGHLSKFKVAGRKSAKFVSFLWRNFGSSYFTQIIAYHQRICPDFDPKSFRKFKVIGEKCKTYVRSGYVLRMIPDVTRRLLMTWGYVMI